MDVFPHLSSYFHLFTVINADNIGPPINWSGLFVNQIDLSMTVIQMTITADFMDNQQRKI